MPRGDNPNSRANLTKKSSKEARELGAKGGKKSGEARRAQASLTESLKEAMTPEVARQITDTIIRKARAGNLKAYELIRDGLGEKPIEKIVQCTDVIVDLGELDGGDTD